MCPWLQELDSLRDDIPRPDVHASGEEVVGEDVTVRDAGEGVADVSGIGRGGRKS
jgi:hypothetical protein